MVSPRAKTLIKLLVLLALPIALVVGLFGWGVYTGVQHRHAVTSFERDWLGMDVEVPPAPQEKAVAAAEEEAAGEALGDNDRAVAGTPPPATGSAPADSAVVTPPPPSAPAPSSDAPPAASAPAPTPAGEQSAADAAAMGAAPVVSDPPAADATAALDSIAKLHLPVVVSVKVLVDQNLIDGRPDWIDQVQRTVATASQAYQRNFGVVLELVGVGRWPIATAGLESAGLLQDLQARSREGADILLGMARRPFDHAAVARGVVPGPSSPYNGAYAVLYADSSSSEPYLRPLLHELGHLFGALDVDDPTSQAYRSGSWMSGAQVAPGSTPWIDPENRERMLSRKDKPFVPEAQVRTEGKQGK